LTSKICDQETGVRAGVELDPVSLRGADNFTILTKTGITNVYPSMVTGSVGTSPITGAALKLECDEIVGTGVVYIVDATKHLPCAETDPSGLTGAISDMELAYADAVGRNKPNAIELGAGEIGGKTLVPGLYRWSSGVSISNNLVLDGNPEDVWIFQIAGDLFQASSVQVELTGGALARNVFWQVAGGVTLGTDSHFEGIVLSKTFIAVNTRTTVTGRLFAQTAVTLQKSVITAPAPAELDNDAYYYPANLVRPPEIWIEFVVPVLHGNKIQGYETPIAVYQTMRVDQLMWNCVAAYDDAALDVLTFQRPRYTGPQQHHNSEARALCMLHAINKLLAGGLVPDAVELFQEQMADVGLDTSVPTNRVAIQAVKRGDKSPQAIGHYLAAKMLKVMKTDGWNFDGSTALDGRKCTANCIIYGDNGASGYAPVNNPFTPPEDPTRWQPLLEHNGHGFVVAQGHVTPHISEVPLQIVQEPLFTRQDIDSRVLPNPDYNLADEADAAIKEVRRTGKSDFRKTTVEFFDNKINLAGGLIMRLREEYRMSLEQQLMYHVGYTTVEHDSIILAWKEKIKHDLIRPTTVVQSRGNQDIFSYKGPFEGSGRLKARDWQPYIRTMPHAEYPSASGCICTVVADYVDAFVYDQFGDPTFATTWDFPVGSSKIEPGVTPATPIRLHLNSMTELRNMCGETRKWGGMHFRASVPDSYQLCGNIGAKAYSGWARQLYPGDVNELFDGAEPYIPNR
jgi:hypothetical protein